MEKITRFKISNFKRFHEFSIHMPENELILCGENGSGKTQILWAFLLFFRGVNMESTKFLQIQSEIFELLAHPSFSKLPNYESFIHSMDDPPYGKASFNASFPSSPGIEVTLKANGILELHTADKKAFKIKLHFAFMGTSYHFNSIANERFFSESKTVLNSSAQVMRQLYHKLSIETKNLINEILIDLFNTIIDERGEGIFALEMPNCKQIEIMFCGSAFQKVLASFTLLFFLSDKQPSTTCKYFLIEEPESLLCPSIIIKFYKHLQTNCCRLGIYLIASTNSEYIYNMAVDGVKVVLKRDLNSVDEDTLKQVLGFMCDDVADRRILLVCDKKDDQNFLEKIMPANLSLHFRVNSFGSQIGKPENIRFLHSRFGGRIVYIRDPEFRDSESTIAFENACKPSRVIHHCLPCFESYYILDALERTQIPLEDLRKYFHGIQPAIHFSNGFNQHKPKFDPRKTKEENRSTEEQYEQRMEQVWNEGFQEAMKDEDWDWIKVVKIIDGRHGVKHLLKIPDSTSILNNQALTGALARECIEKLLQQLTLFVGQLVDSAEVVHDS